MGAALAKLSDVETMLRETHPREGPLEILPKEKRNAPDTPRLQTHAAKKRRMRAERKGMC